ncbi:unnamed protein product [[Candida] boidinii]|uniref:peptidylprolyl isomerase n=1 Tax=Candida boidinii TaxID=5477 RepID=A0A9W6W7N8_CANBO|nr:hypothetical protein B5S30_g4303 [[Candida] boidinii]OWB84760.1 hypothetical protein B5S33_g3412 [[Candida] boidinii]GME67300.1 unnamed protein product [[Candida] boidinii]
MKLFQFQTLIAFLALLNITFSAVIGDAALDSQKGKAATGKDDSAADAAAADAVVPVAAEDAASAKDPPITHLVVFSIEHKGKPLGELEIGLFGTVVPKTVENFFLLSTGEKGYGYKSSIFHRVIDQFMIQGGILPNNQGPSIYGASFDDENFKLKHDKPGRLAMANSGKNTNGSQFYITSIVAAWLDGHHVVFGQLLKGIELVNKIAILEKDKSDKPYDDVVISAIKTEKLSPEKYFSADSVEAELDPTTKSDDLIGDNLALTGAEKETDKTAKGASKEEAAIDGALDKTTGANKETDNELNGKLAAGNQGESDDTTTPKNDESVPKTGDGKFHIGTPQNSEPEEVAETSQRPVTHYAVFALVGFAFAALLISWKFRPIVTRFVKGPRYRRI